jgi:hypothetical protein
MLESCNILRRRLKSMNSMKIVKVYGDLASIQWRGLAIFLVVNGR